MPDSRNLIRAVLVAGLLAGLVTGVFHLVVSEPFVDRAIDLEARIQEREFQSTGATDERHDEVFSRRTQKGGLIVGTLLYGVAVGALFAGAYALLAARLPGRSQRARVAALAGAALAAVVLVPFLKYPPNPPGVGDPGTLARRQLLYVSCVLLSFAGFWLAARLASRLQARAGRRKAVGGAVLFGLVWSALLLLLLPGRTDPVHTPTGLLWQFRTASLAGQLVFWVVFGALFAAVLERPGRNAAAMEARL